MSSQTYADLILADSPTVYLKLNEDVGGDNSTSNSLTAVDYSGGHNDAPYAPVGAGSNMWVHFQNPLEPFLPAAPIDVPVRFLSAFAQTTNSFTRSGGNTISLESWVIDDLGSGSLLSIIHADDSGSHRIFQFRRTAAGKLEFVLFDSGISGHTVTGTKTITDGLRHHVAAVYDGSTLILYVDGEVDATLSATFTLSTHSSQIRFGWGQNLSGFTGLMSHAAYYAGALPAARIKAHYTAGLTAQTPQKVPRIVVPTAPSTAKSGSDTLSLSLETQNVNGANVVQDSDTPSLADIPSVAAALSSSDSASEAESAASNNPSGSDLVTFAETSANAIAQGPTPSDSEQFSASAAVGSLNVALSSSESVTFSEAPPAVSTPDHLALSSSDSASITDLAANSSGGIGSSFYGVVIAFGNDALDADPDWTRLDDPNGTA